MMNRRRPWFDFHCSRGTNFPSPEKGTAKIPSIHSWCWVPYCSNFCILCAFDFLLRCCKWWEYLQSSNPPKTCPRYRGFPLSVGQDAKYIQCHKIIGLVFYFQKYFCPQFARQKKWKIEWIVECKKCIMVGGWVQTVYERVLTHR